MSDEKKPEQVTPFRETTRMESNDEPTGTSFAAERRKAQQQKKPVPESDTQPIKETNPLGR